MLDIRNLFIHCSATKNFEQYPIEKIDRYHRMRGWESVGYHRVFQPDGTVEIGRSLNEIGAGVFGQNRKSIHFCIIGNDRFSEDAIEQLFLSSLAVCRGFTIPIEAVLGHYEVDGMKTCPNIDMNVFRGALSTMLTIKRLKIGA